jgi:hypothetical protein
MMLPESNMTKLQGQSVDPIEGYNLEDELSVRRTLQLELD